MDIINGSQDEVRPSVLVSASAIGYYGLSPLHFSNHYFLYQPLENEYAFLGLNRNHLWDQFEILEI